MEREIEDYKERIDDLKEQVYYQDIWRKEYIKRIDKAIEYIEKYADEYFSCFEDQDTWSTELKDLLNILKGE